MIGHWILISPRADPSNSLNAFLERLNSEQTFPFEVQVWSPETGVAELFGLEPEVYDQFFRPAPGASHPRDWSERQREGVRAKWRRKLEPPLRLPRGWADYVRKPALLCLQNEDPQKMEETHMNSVGMLCRNAAGTLLENPLDHYIDEWLLEKDTPVLFLLGEFGDGKSFYTYVLARRLAERWIHQPEQSWLPLRLALRDYGGHPRDFLRRRLEEFNADVGGWRELGTAYHRLVILDGFDEMSRELDPDSVTNNIRNLLQCLEEFRDCKILITSRTHFFESRSNAERLMKRVSKSVTYHLAPIARRDVLAHLGKVIPGAAGQRLLASVKAMNDPIGLAGKPLFLDMLKEVLCSPEIPANLDVVTLYERHIDQSLRRKIEFLDDPDMKASPEVTVSNLRRILGDIAEEIQRTGCPYIALNRYASGTEENFAQLLWRISGPEILADDAKARIGARSLLTPVSRYNSEGEWLVDFCHRSVREYFLSTRLRSAVQAGEEQGARFLQEIPLNHEILEFAVGHWRKDATGSIKRTLCGMLRRARLDQAPGRMGGYAMTLLHRLGDNLPRNFDWTGKVFDGVDLEGADLSCMDFRRSSFRNANLANVNFEGSDFRECDLSGVRIEETAPVVALGSYPSGERLVAAYRDGVLREWDVRSGSRLTSKLVGSVTSEPGSAVGVHETGQPWMRTPRKWMFFRVQDDGTWNKIASFVIKDTYEGSLVCAHLLAFTERVTSGAVHAVVMDLTGPVRTCTVRTNGARHCACLGEDAIVWSDSGVGFRIASTRHDGPYPETILPCTEPSCLDVRRISEGRYLVAGGGGNGRVWVWEVASQGESWSRRQVFDYNAHVGPVTAVTLLDETRLASGGLDCSVAVLCWNGAEGGECHLESRLQLRLHCNRMKIAGLRGAVEYERLRELGADATEA